METRSRSIPGVQKTLAAAVALAMIALRLMGETIPVSVALMLLATQPAQAWGIGAIDITPHDGTATRGQPFVFTITVTNDENAATSGTVTVTDFVPDGLTATSMNGTGWNCTLSPPTNSCTRSDVLAVGASYPPISLRVNVANNAPDLVSCLVAGEPPQPLWFKHRWFPPLPI
jgi:uncharacterized repeat protein (TIGR01451 family)